MNKRIDLSYVGGFPLEEETLDFMQESYRGAFGAIAKFCGNKVIITGVEVAGVNVTDGWIVYNGEMIPFVGGLVAAAVVITDLPDVVQTEFEDELFKDVYFTKKATCGAIGDFDFSELKTLDTYKTLQTKLEDLIDDYLNHTHAWADITGKPSGLITHVGNAAIGNPVTDQTYTIAIPDQGAATYKVFGTIVSNGGNPFLDNDISWVLVNGTKTPTTFQISIREYENASQNLSFDFAIVKAN